MTSFHGNRIGTRTADSTGPASAAIAAVLTLTVAGLTARLLGLGPVDDAFISLRYATNWAGGLGLSFNPGETVEGYTNFLWVALETVAIRLGADPVAAMQTLGWLSLAALAWVLALFLERFVLPGRSLLAALGATAIALHPSLIGWAAAGMESCLYAALVLLCLLVALSGTGAPRAATVGVIVALTAMTRPEAVALVPVLASVVWLRRRQLLEVGWVLAGFTLVYGVYFVARWAHFGYLLPNTFYAKLDYGNVPLLQRGVLYLWDFVQGSPVVVALALLAAVMAHRAPRWVQATAMAAGAQMLFVLWEGGDHFAMFRFLVPVIPLLGVLALYPVVRVTANWSRPASSSASAAFAVIVLIAVSSLPITRQIKRDDLPGMTQLTRLQLESQLAREWSAMGKWLATTAPENSSLLTVAIGAIGYFSEMTIVDPHGLIDPVIAHQTRTLGTGYAGHEKFDTEYVLAKRPSYVLLANRITQVPLPSSRLPDDVWGSFNQEILANPGFDALYDYRPSEMARGQYINLHVSKE